MHEKKFDARILDTDGYVFELTVVIHNRPVAVVQIMAQDYRTACEITRSEISFAPSDHLLPTININEKY